jgi:hypothetical protein
MMGRPWWWQGWGDVLSLACLVVALWILFSMVPMP